MSILTRYMQLVAGAHELSKNLVFHGSYSNWETLQQYCVHDSVYLQNIYEREGIQMSKFKVGDKVRRRAGDFGSVKQGGEYTVSFCGKATLKLEGSEILDYDPDFFDLVQEPVPVAEPAQSWVKLLSDSQLIALWVATRVKSLYVVAMHRRHFSTAGNLLAVYTVNEVRLFNDLDNELSARGIDSRTGKKRVTKTRVIPERTEEYTEYVLVNEL